VLFTKSKMIVVSGLFMLVVGCNSSNTTGNLSGSLAASGTMQYTLDGTAYTAPAQSTGGSATGSYAVFLRSQKLLLVYGIIQTGMREIILSTSGFVDTGKVNLGGDVSGNPAAPYPGSLTYTDSLSAGQARGFCTNGMQTGTVTLTTFDTTAKVVSGTFSATMGQFKPTTTTATTSLTAGSFTDVPIQMQ